MSQTGPEDRARAANELRASDNSAREQQAPQDVEATARSAPTSEDCGCVPYERQCANHAGGPVGQFDGYGVVPRDHVRAAIAASEAAFDRRLIVATRAADAAGYLRGRVNGLAEALSCLDAEQPSVEIRALIDNEGSKL